MSVCSEVITDSTADCQRDSTLENDCDDTDSRGGSPTFIVTNPDSDIETDAVPNAPRPRGTPIPDPPKPQNLDYDEPSRNEESQEKDSENFTKFRKIPNDFFKKKSPKLGRTSVINVCNSHNLHIGNNFMFMKDNMGSQNNREEPSPPKYEILISSKKVVNDQHLDCVADNIGKQWKELGKYLGMKESAIFRFQEDYKNDHRERVYQLLLEWKQGTGGPNQAPLLARLSLVLWQLRERDALESLVKLEEDPRLNCQ